MARGGRRRCQQRRWSRARARAYRDRGRRICRGLTTGPWGLGSGAGEDDGDARATGRQSGESAARARGGRSGRTRTGRRWWRGRLRGRGRGGEVSGRWRCGTQRRRRCPRASGLLPLPDPDRVGEEGRGGRRAGEAATRRTARRRRRCTRGDRARGDPLPGTMRACVLVCVCCVVAAGEGDEGEVGIVRGKWGGGSLGFGRPRGL